MLDKSINKKNTLIFILLSFFLYRGEKLLISYIEEVDVIMIENLNDRLFNFTMNVLKLLPRLPKSPEFKVIRYQLTKSGFNC